MKTSTVTITEPERDLLNTLHIGCELGKNNSMSGASLAENLQLYEIKV